MNIAQVAASTPKATAAKEVESVNLYDDLPHTELTLDQFEIYALKRLKVLRKIEQLKMMKLSPDQAKAKLDVIIRQEQLNDPLIDEASHYILRLSYCQNEELRRWFLLHESLLLEHRLASLKPEQLAQAVSKYTQISPISKQEKEQIKHVLMNFCTLTEFATTSFYAVPFLQALDLVRTRQCYLSNGYAYVSVNKVYNILVSKFRSELSRQLAMMGQAGMEPSDPETTRVYPLLKNLHSSLVAREPSAGEFATNGSNLTAATVPNFVSHMPLCMRQLHNGMKQDRKLKHWGRLQYGLFLKGAGLSMEDAIAFFQKHFTAVTGEVFQKQYSYNIRHMYGKEGKRATYTPYSCQKIILGNPPTSQDHHGCPYKHYDSDHLSGLLSKLNIGNPTERREIIKLQKDKQYQLACQKHFEVTHPKALTMPEISLDNVGNHPNAWFRASVAYAETQMPAVSPEKN